MKETTHEVDATLLTRAELDNYKQAKKEDNNLPKPRFNVVIHYTAENNADLLEKLAEYATDRGPIIRLQDEIRQFTSSDVADAEEQVQNWRQNLLDQSDDGKIHVDADEIYEGIFLDKTRTRSKLTTEQKVERELAKMSPEQLAAFIQKLSN